VSSGRVSLRDHAEMDVVPARFGEPSEPSVCVVALSSRDSGMGGLRLSTLIFSINRMLRSMLFVLARFVKARKSRGQRHA
jgi:hypothetical protein